MLIRMLCALVLTTAVALYQPGSVASGNFDGCAPRGTGGDPALNIQKNRSAAAQSPAGVTVASLKQLPTVPESDGKTRAKWPATLRSTIESRESDPVIFTGYIIKAKAEGPESCNCESTAARDHDVHVYVADSANELNVGDSAIVEVTPRWRAVHTDWNANNLQALAADGTPVRITGWLLYDQEHWNMIQSGERGTLWEIHPITRIEVQDPGGSWHDVRASNFTAGGK